MTSVCEARSNWRNDTYVNTNIVLGRALNTAP